MSQLQDQTFHQSFAKVACISQCFAVLPVTNVLHGNVHQLQYRWLSLQVAYSALVLVLNSLEFSTVVNMVHKTGLDFHNSGTLAFFVVCMLEQLFFWRLAKQWPSIMRAWRQAEEVFLRPPYRLYATFNMRARIYAFTFVVMSGALVEHCVLVFNSFHKSALEHTQCKLNITLWETLFRRERPHLYLALPYHIWLLPLAEWINLTLAYPRSFTDAFIICISIGLTARFRQLYLRIAAAHTKAVPLLFWTEVREHHLLLKRLLRLVNDAIAPLVLLACSNNMYFICFQLFNSFQNIGVDLVAELAFWYSLLIAIARTMLTLYVAATINEYSRRILATLRDVPSRSWCLEIQRFSEQLALDLTALSGCGFFFLTRKLILAMASTIVTYELMVTDVINKGSIQQITDYCSTYELEELIGD